MFLVELARFLALQAQVLLFLFIINLVSDDFLLYPLGAHCVIQGGHSLVNEKWIWADTSNHDSFSIATQRILEHAS